jgi:hypothetical protein
VQLEQLRLEIWGTHLPLGILPLESRAKNAFPKLCRAGISPPFGARAGVVAFYPNSITTNTRVLNTQTCSSIQLFSLWCANAARKTMLAEFLLNSCLTRTLLESTATS